MTQKTCVLTLSLALLAVSASAAAVPSLEASFGEAVHSLRAYRPGAFADGRNEDQLLQLLDDRNIEVRASAAKALRDYVQDRKVTDRLVEMMDDGWENAAVRRQAIKTLSYAADQSNEVRRALIRAATEQERGPALRAIACKALWPALEPSAGANDARKALQKIVSDGSEHPDVRAGAAWGLFPDAQRGRGTQDALLAVAKDQWAAEGLRVEALRSLYFALPERRDLEADVRALADETLTPLNVRVAAVLIHQIQKDENPASHWLSDLAANASPDQVRSAAITAQADLTPEMARYFHYTSWRRRFLDPIAGE